MCKVLTKGDARSDVLEPRVLPVEYYLRETHRGITWALVYET